MRPRGRPLPPRAMSRASEPVEIPSIVWFAISPRRMIAPLATVFSMSCMTLLTSRSRSLESSAMGGHLYSGDGVGTRTTEQEYNRRKTGHKPGRRYCRTMSDKGDDRPVPFYVRPPIRLPLIGWSWRECRARGRPARRYGRRLWREEIGNVG